MSTEHEIVEKLKEALETRNTDVVAPYVAEDATVDILPSTFVVVPPGGTSHVLSATIQGREEDDWGWVDRRDGRKTRCLAVRQGQDLLVYLALLSTDDSSSSMSSTSLSTPCSPLSRQVNLTLRNFARGLIQTTAVGKPQPHPPVRPTRL